MILDSDTVTLTETTEIEELVEEYCMLPEGTEPSGSTTWSTTLPTYVDNVGGTQNVYWVRKKLIGYTEDSTPVVKEIYSATRLRTDKTQAAQAAAMVRQYGAGVLVCRKGKTVGALVNADGSFDVVEVSWSGDTPTAGSVLASYGNKLMVMKDNEGSEYLRLEDLRNSNGRLTVKEKLSARTGKYLYPSYDIYSVTSIVHTSDSSSVTSFTNTTSDIQSSTFVVGDTYTVTYVSDDYSLKAYTFGSRSSTGTKGAQSFSVGEQNRVSGIESVAFGDSNSITGDHSISIGSGNTISKDWAMVVGYGSTANRDGQIIFGNGNTPDSSHKLEVVEDGINIFTINASTGGVVIRDPTTGTYGHLVASRTGNGDDYFMVALYDNGGVRNKRISLMDDNILVDGVKQFYDPYETVTLNPTSPYAGYITNSTSTIRITIPMGKSLQFVNAIEVVTMVGAIIGPNGYVNLPGTSAAGSHQTSWKDNTVSISATKIDNFTIGLTLVGTAAFYNATNNRPYVYVPSYGGITFNFEP